MSANTLEIFNLVPLTLPTLFTRRQSYDLPVIAGLTPFTTIDYPEHLSAVLFLQGCPLRCVYCHNQHLLNNSASEQYSQENLLSFLKQRQGKLDAIVISGGEPLLHKNISNLISLIKEHGFKVGLHTSGAYPERLDKILNELDWIGFDFKALFPEYAQITQVKGSGQKAFESAQLILNSSVDYEFRTTVTGQYHTEENLLLGAQQLSRLGVKKYSLQRQRDAANKTQIEFSTNLIDQIRPLFEILNIR